MGKHTVIRYHDFCAGHRVVGHESKCRHLHGHNYRVHFHVQVKDEVNCLDNVGRVVDFSVVKEKLCNWLEENWDHKFLHWQNDMLLLGLVRGIHGNDFAAETAGDSERENFMTSLVPVPFNPTAENMAKYLVEYVGPRVLRDELVELVGVELEETRKCSVSYFKEEK